MFPDGRVVVLYSSPRDLLQKTPGFFDKTRLDRLEGTFGGAHQFAAKHFGGQSLYMEAVRRNMEHLARVIRDDGWSLLRRRPPLFTAEEVRRKPVAAPAPPSGASPSSKTSIRSGCFG